MNQKESDPFCFVITPIGQPDSDERNRADRLCKQIVEPTLHEFGIRTLRGDQQQQTGPITVQLVQCITDAKLIVADLVDPNPNVYYELGIAESFHKPVIRFGGADAEALPFDVRNMRTIPLPKQPDGRIDIEDAMSGIQIMHAMLPELLSSDFKPQSVISLAERRAQFEDAAGRLSGDKSDREALILKELINKVDDLSQDMNSLKTAHRHQATAGYVPGGVLAGTGLGWSLGSGFVTNTLQAMEAWQTVLNQLSAEDRAIAENGTASMLIGDVLWVNFPDEPPAELAPTVSLAAKASGLKEVHMHKQFVYKTNDTQKNESNYKAG